MWNDEQQWRLEVSNDAHPPTDCLPRALAPRVNVGGDIELLARQFIDVVGSKRSRSIFDAAESRVEVAQECGFWHRVDVRYVTVRESFDEAMGDPTVTSADVKYAQFIVMA